MNCSHVTSKDELEVACEKCASAVVLLDSAPKVRRSLLEELPPGVWRFRAFLPEVPRDDLVTLGEGGTPLLPAERLGKELGMAKLLIKDESRNPTGSFIDRGSTVLMSLAKNRGTRECTCLTTGNLGASLAAYCARAGIAAQVKIHPSTDRGKLYQMLAYGAQVEVPSQRHEAKSTGENSLSVTAGNPFILEGEKTTAFEILQDLGWRSPDAIIVPVGTGGHLSMIWKGLAQLRECGLVGRSKCRLLGVQFEGVAPRAARSDDSYQGEPFTELEESEPFFRREAVRAIRDSGGLGLTTTSAETIRATALLASTEGIFSEPASASVIAALRGARDRGIISRDEEVVCVVTGAGLKDTKAISRLAKTARRVPVREEYAVAKMQIGETKIAILRLLGERPSYGYELWQKLALQRKITTASIYQHLAELEGMALVHRSGVVTSAGRERVQYGLTRSGTDFLRMAGTLEQKSRDELGRV